MIRSMMTVNNQECSSERENSNVFFAIVLSLFPILSPYAFGTKDFSISISYTLMLIILIYFALFMKKFPCDKSLILVLILYFVMTLISFLGTPSNDTDFFLAFRVFIAFLLNLITISNIWSHVESKVFYNVALKVGVICALFAISQFIFVSLGFTNFYNGRLPFILDNYSNFGSLIDPNTGMIRVHSFFEEPSYLAIYELPVTVYCIQKKKYYLATITGISCLIAGTLLGILGLIIILILLFILNESMELKRKKHLLFLIAIAILIFYCILQKNTAVHTMFDYYLKRISNINYQLERTNSSASQRLIGNIYLFEKYSIFNRIIGTGLNQYHLYFNLPNDYSNDFVCTILNYGILGIIFLIIYIFNLFIKIKKENTIYLIIFIMILFLDHIWFNAYFFYLLSWCMFGMNKKEIGTFKERAKKNYENWYFDIS